jgi:hypothetical protein
MESLESVLSTMVSLRVFSIDLDTTLAEDYLSLIMKTSTHLQYYTAYDNASKARCWKQLRGEWIVCDETGCPWQH